MTEEEAYNLALATIRDYLHRTDTPIPIGAVAEIEADMDAVLRVTFNQSDSV